MPAARQMKIVWLVIQAAILVTGCQPQQGATPPARVTNVAPQPKSPRSTSSSVAATKTAPQPDVNAGGWQDRFSRAEAALAAGKLEEAQAALTSLDDLDLTAQPPTAEQERQRQDLELKLAAARRVAEQIRRAENLASAQKALDDGRFVDALRLAAEVTAANPSPEEHQQAAAVRVEVRRRQEVRRAWQPQLALLASASRRDLETVQAELRKDPDVAFPVLAELSQRTNDPATAAGALETLAMLDRPQRALPLLVAVLSRDSQRDLWEVAKRQIVAVKTPGAGASLLALATGNAPIEQRLAALDTLAQVIDPPPETLVKLLPLVNGDGPLLRRALSAAAHAAIVHGQFDVATARVLGDLTPAEEELFATLPARLKELSAAAAASPDVALSAQELLVALRLEMPQALAVAKVVSSTDVPECPAAALIDGIWDSADLKTMWRHPADQPGSITLDLGQERTIVCVKVWNWNEPGGSLRGWKDAQVSIGKTVADFAPAARGIVPPAPGAAGMPDYGTLISVPCVRGRYVRLESTSLWQPGGHSGLAEVQVLGF